jgi:mono/diheme cytochrome c family protein
MRSRLIVQWTCILALGIAAAPAPGHSDEVVPIDQGWSTQQKVAWYTLSQGSRLLPLSWFRALEQPGSSRPFLETANIEKFRYLPHASAGAGRLPIGFTIDTQNDTNLGITHLRWKANQSNREAWMGLNCSACHTSEITFQGKRMRVEGGATLADAQSFIEDVNLALVETRDNAEKQDRFAKAVLKGADTPANRAMLKKELARYVAWQQKLAKANATPLRYGFARLDAFGFIFNKVTALVDVHDQTVNPSDAPVSYPFLWNIHQFDKVQWNGIAKNVPLTPTFDIGALGRNVGEVIGVFADVQLKRIAPDGYRSSANIKNLNQLEQLLATLKPPAWPEAVLGPINAGDRAAGEKIFGDRCANCHQPLARNDLKTRIEVKMTPLKGPEPAGTDVWMACNAYTYEAKTGLLNLTPKKFFVGFSLPLGDTASVAEMLGATGTGVIWNKRKDVLRDFTQSIRAVSFFDPKLGPKAFNLPPLEFQLPELIRPLRDDAKEARFKRCMTETSDILAYKGRPLTGIWATPPYLHSGSVPTLYDLLLPPEDRPKSFYLGSREFDPAKVGYVTAQSADNSFLYRTRDDAGRIIDGNSNAGHDYGNAALSDKERKALVEYLKGL